jgi:hypothetical protein
MYRGKRVVAFIPYGRKLTVSVLLPYLLREHELGVLDEVMLCMNTDEGQGYDVLYAAQTQERHPHLVKLYERPGPLSPRSMVLPTDWRRGFRSPKQMNTGRFCIYMQDRDTVYVRFDDDIVWVHPQAIRRIVDCEIDRPEVLACFPVIVNNAVSSFYLQQRGALTREWGHVRLSAVDPVGWGNPIFAEKLHNHVLWLIDTGEIDSMLADEDIELHQRQQFSVSCFAINGSEYADLDGILDWDEEEHWLTTHRPTVVRKVNVIRRSALVSHFSFFTQRDHLLRTDILDRYQKLSEAVAADL